MFPVLSSYRNNIAQLAERLQSSDFTVEDLLDEDDVFQFVKNGSDDSVKN